MVERGRLSQKLHGVGSQRSSQRSHGTSSSSSHESKFVCKEFSRKFASFMCTQVGVGALMVAYSIIGAFSFKDLECIPSAGLKNLTIQIRDDAVKKLWNVTEEYNLIDMEKWNYAINTSLMDFQTKVIKKIKDDGYAGSDGTSEWCDISSTLMFCLSVFTMIGYGHMTPRTNDGKIATMVYAIFGIPLYIVYFMNMGKVFAKCFKFLYRFGYRCINKKEEEQDTEQGPWEETNIVVPSTACIWVMIFYMLIGTIMFRLSEKWSIVDAWYFTFTSLAKIGIGDFVPGRKEFVKGKQIVTHRDLKLFINFVYLLIGMALIAMCCTLMREEFVLKLRTVRQELREKCYYCGIRIGLYSEDQPVQVPPQRSRPKIRRSVRRR